MQIAAITKFKNGVIWEALKRLGWTQTELANRAKIKKCRIGEIINLQKRPKANEADAIQVAFGEVGVFVDVLAEWPESFAGLKRGFQVEQVQNIEVLELSNSPEALQIAAPEAEDNEALYESVINAVATLPARPREAIEEIFLNGKTLAEAGSTMGVTGECARVIRESGLRKLRYPSRIRKLIEHLPQYEQFT